MTIKLTKEETQFLLQLISSVTRWGKLGDPHATSILKKIKKETEQCLNLKSKKKLSPSTRRQSQFTLNVR